MLMYMESADESLAVNAIRSFPYVTVPDPTQERSIVRRVAHVAVHDDPEVAETAFASLSAYAMQRPDLMLAPLVNIFLDALGNRSFSRGHAHDYAHVLQGFGYLQRLILIYLGSLEKTGRPCAVNSLDWVRAREHAEGVVVMWLVHSDPAVRKGVLEVLRLFSHPVFTAVEEARGARPTRLVEVLPAADDSAPGVWSAHLVRLVSLHPPPMPTAASGAPAADGSGAFDGRPLVERFRRALEFAWVRLSQRFNGALEVLPTLDAEKVGLWLNYAKFLCLSVPYPREGGDPSETRGPINEDTDNCVEPRELDDFWAALLRVAWADRVPMEIRHALLNYFEQIHPSCIEFAVAVIKALRDAPPPAVEEHRRRLRRKKKTAAADDDAGQLVAVGWIFHEEVLELLARFVTRLTKRAAALAALAHQPTSPDGRGRAHSGSGSSFGVALTYAELRAEVGGPMQRNNVLPLSLAQTLAFCVSAWVADFEKFGAGSCRKLSLGTRLAGMRMVKVYLNPLAGVMGGYTDVPPANKLISWLLAWTPPPQHAYVEAAYRHVPHLVAQLMREGAEDEGSLAPAAAPPVPTAADERMRMALEVAVVEALEALLALGPLGAGGGEAVQLTALDFLQMMALRGPHLRKAVVRGLSAFLRSQPNFVGHYFKLSVVDFGFDELGLTVPAAELLSSMQLAAMVDTWVANMPEWLERHQVPLPHMLLVCLLHQCSPDGASRGSAIDLAKALTCLPVELALDAGSALPTAEFVTLSSCVASTYKYSQTLAALHSARLAEPLLRELVAVARLLPDVQNESMLHMVLPWISHFGTDFSTSDVDEWRATWHLFLAHLLELSHQCHERANSSFLFFTLEACWTAVLQGKESTKLCELTMEFLVSTHDNASAAAARARGSHGRGSAGGAAGGAPPSGGGEEGDAESAALIRHLCTRITLFIAAGGRAASMLDQLLDDLPGYGSTDIVPPSAGAADLLGVLELKAAGAAAADAEMRAEAANGKQVSAFLLASELLLAHTETLAHRMPLLLHIALVHFGAGTASPVGGELLSKLLAKLTPLPKDRRAPLEAPPEHDKGRRKLVGALCEASHAPGELDDLRGQARAERAKAAGASLREAWAAVALTWALNCPNEVSSSEALLWFGALVRHRPLAYAECHRLVALLAVSFTSGRYEVARATLLMLRDHTAQLESLNYRSGVLLCVAAVLAANSQGVDTFALALSLLRATLQRTPAVGTTDLAHMELVRRPPPATVTRPDGTVATEHSYDPDPMWKSRLLQEALDAQLALWDVRGQPLSADELLRMLLLRGGALARSREDAIWLFSELKAIYQPHLPPCDELGIAHLWLLLQQACAAPRKPAGDAACEQAVSWIAARGGAFEHTRQAFEQLHSSADRSLGAAAYAWATGGSAQSANAESENWWHTSVAEYLATLKGVFPSGEEQQRAFTVMLEACCLHLLLEEDAATAAGAVLSQQPSAEPGTAAESEDGGAAAAAAAAAAEAAASPEAIVAQRWATLCLLGALLTEFRGLWSASQHAATAQLLSSLAFSLANTVHAAKLRADMQWLVTDPTAEGGASLLFVRAASSQGYAPAEKRAVGAAAEAKATLATGRFPESFHLQLLAEDEWLASLTSLIHKLQPMDSMVASLEQQLSLVTIAPPELPKLPQGRVTSMAATSIPPASLPTSQLGGAQDAAQPARARGLSTSVVQPPPSVPGVRVTRGESISALLPPPPPLPSLPPMMSRPPSAGLTASRPHSSSVVLPPPPIAASQLPGAGAPTPAPLPLDLPPPPVLASRPTDFTAPPPPVLGSRAAAPLAAGTLPPPPPLLATAGGSSRALPPAPVLATGASSLARRISELPQGPAAPPPPLQQQNSPLQPDGTSFQFTRQATREFI